MSKSDAPGNFIGVIRRSFMLLLAEAGIRKPYATRRTPPATNGAVTVDRRRQVLRTPVMRIRLFHPYVTPFPRWLVWVNAGRRELTGR
jgi:hypothetical protein